MALNWEVKLLEITLGLGMGRIFLRFDLTRPTILAFPSTGQPGKGSFHDDSGSPNEMCGTLRAPWAMEVALGS